MSLSPSPYCRVAKVEQNQKGRHQWLGFDKYKKFIIGVLVKTDENVPRNKPKYLQLVKFNVYTEETAVCGNFLLTSGVKTATYSYFYQFVLNPKESSVVVQHHRKNRYGDVEYGYMFSRLMTETGDWQRFDVAGEVGAEHREHPLYYMDKFGVIMMRRFGSPWGLDMSGEVGIYAVEFNEVRMQAVIKLIDKLPAEFDFSLEAHFPVTNTKIISFDMDPQSKRLHVYDAQSMNASSYNPTENYQLLLETGEITENLSQYSPFVEFDGEVYTVNKSQNENGEETYYLQMLVLTNDKYEFVNAIPLFSFPGLKDRCLIAMKYGKSFGFFLATHRRFLLPPLNAQTSSLQHMAFANCRFLRHCSYESLVQQWKVPGLLIREYFGPKWTLQARMNLWTIK